MQRSDVSKDGQAGRKFSRRELLKWMGVGTAGAVLAGCVPAGAPAASSDAGSDASSDGPSTVEIWTGFGQGRMADAMTGAVEKFGEENPEFVGEHVIIPWGEIHDKVLAATAAQTAPDAYRGWAWIVADDAAIGGLTDLTDLFAATGT